MVNLKIKNGTRTFGDWEEICNVPGNTEVMYRCGICGDAFESSRVRSRHHKTVKESKYVYHKPARNAGAGYMVDKDGYRVNELGRRY